MIDIDNSDAQADDAFKKGSTRSSTCCITRRRPSSWGGELQWGKRENFRDGFTSDDFRIQFSAKYNFKLSLGGK